MITNGENYHSLAATNSSAFLQGSLSNHEGDIYCLKCFNSYASKNKRKEYEEICNNHNSCRIEMSKWVEKILKYNPGEKLLKAPFAIYLECLLKKCNLLKTTPKNLTQRKKRDMSLLIGQCLQDVHLIKKKIKLIITEEKNSLKN